MVQREWQDGEFWFDGNGSVYIQSNIETGPLRSGGVFFPTCFTPGDGIIPHGKIDLDELAQLVQDYCKNACDPDEAAAATAASEAFWESCRDEWDMPEEDAAWNHIQDAASGKAPNPEVSGGSNAPSAGKQED